MSITLIIFYNCFYCLFMLFCFVLSDIVNEQMNSFDNTLDFLHVVKHNSVSHLGNYNCEFPPLVTRI